MCGILEIRVVRREQVLAELAAYRPESEALGLVDDRLRRRWAPIDSLPGVARTHVEGRRDETEGALLAAALNDVVRRKRSQENVKAIWRLDTATRARR